MVDPGIKLGSTRLEGEHPNLCTMYHSASQYLKLASKYAN